MATELKLPEQDTQRAGIVRPDNYEELIDELLRGQKVFSLQWIASLGYVRPPVLTADMSHEQRCRAIADAREATRKSLIASDLLGISGFFASSDHDHVDREITKATLSRMHIDKGTWSRLQRNLDDRLDREACQRREAARVSNHVIDLIAKQRKQSRRNNLADLRQAVERLVDGDAGAIATVTDLADQLDLADFTIVSMAADAEQRQANDG